MSAASKSAMDALHGKVAKVFMSVLERYHARLTAIENLDLGSMGDIEEEVLKELFDDGAMPSPAMLAAVTKFLKDNEIMFDKGVVEEVSATKKALEERNKNRPNLANLTLVPKVAGE